MGEAKFNTLSEIHEKWNKINNIKSTNSLLFEKLNKGVDSKEDERIRILMEQNRSKIHELIKELGVYTRRESDPRLLGNYLCGAILFILLATILFSSPIQKKIISFFGKQEVICTTNPL